MRFIGEYYRAGNPGEALDMLQNGKGRGCFIAGGTDILLFNDPKLDFVVDISTAGLDEIAVSPEGDLFIGATTTLRALEISDEVRGFAGGLIAAAAARCGNRPVRTTATVGGNLCHALPSADMVPALLALDAVAYITDGEADESLMLRDFFIGPRQTVLEGRLLIGLALPADNRDCSTAIRKLARTAEDISLVQVAVAVHLSADKIEHARIALGAVAPVPMLAEEAGQILAGVPLDDVPDAIIEAAHIAALISEPIDDMRASAEYRRDMVDVLTRRALFEAVGREGETS